MKMKSKLIIIIIIAAILLAAMLFPVFVKSYIRNSEQHDEHNDGSSKYMVGFDFSSYADPFGMAPVILCQVRWDHTIDATYTRRSSDGKLVMEVKNYKIPDDKYTNILYGIDYNEIKKLNPKCSNPNEVSDGGDCWLFLYGPDDEVTKECGGFCPTSKRFNEIRRLLFDNLPDELITDYKKYEKELGYGY